MKTAPEGSIVIVGGGTMGLFLAHELMQRGKTIILIEAGNQQSQSFGDDEYASRGFRHTGIAIGRAKGIGGTTNLWGGQLAEFLPVDVESRGNYDQPPWIVSWPELKQYYKQTYAKLGFEGQTVDYAEAIKPISGKSLELFYTHWLRQPNFKNHFYNALHESSLVTIYENTIASNLIFSGDRCTSIELLSDGKTEELRGFDKIVLASGTFEICRLLLVSARQKNCPFSDNQFIGKYFQDHPVLRVGSIQNASKPFFSKFSNVIRKGSKLQPKLRINSTTQDHTYLGVSGFFSFTSDVTQHLDNFKQFAKAVLGRSQKQTTLKDKVMMFFKVAKTLPQIMPLIFRYIKDNQIFIPFNSKITLSIQAQQISVKDSAISISQTELDKSGRPKVELNWKLDGRELKPIREFALAVKAYLEENNLGKLVLEDWLTRDSNDWLEHVGDNYHQAGGLIMSASKNQGVLDVNLRMHETANVFACGPCVLPTSSYANTGLTSLALTYRLADHLTGA
ncbi:MAG TPA: FAD-dependent oxidoreductase [Chryseolinea sp.]|nr:FAD-dependent oxidoreductase [Chryseolinea sp.]